MEMEEKRIGKAMDRQDLDVLERGSMNLDRYLG